MNKFNMVLNELAVNAAGEKEYKKIGEQSINIFSLEEFGVTATPNEALTEEGLLEYANPVHAFIYSALVAATKAAAKNKMLPKSVTLRPGSKLAETLEELTAKSERVAGQAMILTKEFIAAFTKYLAESSGKKPVVQQIYLAMVKSRPTISLSTPARREGLAAQLEQFVAVESAEVVAKFESILTALNEACSSDEVLDDMDL